MSHAPSKAIAAIGAAALGAVALAGCSSNTTNGSAAVHGAAHDVTMINGEVPPGEPTTVAWSEPILDVVQDGTRHLTFRDTRLAGTRAPIHQHPYGGTSCVVTGEMTLFLEGSAPQVAHPGDCYWMPSGLPMTGANTGTTDAIIYDFFAVPDGEAVWEVVEKGQEHLQGNFNSGN